jgi:hypothetical protein
MAPNGRAEARSRMFALITAIAASSFWGSDQKGRRLALLGLRSQNAADPSRAADPDRLLLVRSCLYDHFKTTVDHPLSVKWHRVRTRL